VNKVRAGRRRAENASGKAAAYLRDNLTAFAEVLEFGRLGEVKHLLCVSSGSSVGIAGHGGGPGNPGAPGTPGTPGAPGNPGAPSMQATITIQQALTAS
jgi:nucleoside-diphosphate-sugar epimerase